MDGLGTFVEVVVFLKGGMKDKLRVILNTLIWDCVRAAGEDLINLVVADFTTTSINIFAAAGA